MCKHEQASIERQLEPMKSGKVRTGEDIGSGWIDTTEESVERADACHEDPAGCTQHFEGLAEVVSLNALLCKIHVPS